MPRARAIAAALALVLAAGCTRAPEPGPIRRLSAWIVDWDLERGLDELARHGRLFDEVHLFAAYFRPDARPWVDPAWQQRLPDLERWRGGTGGELWLTVVNDRLEPSGRHAQKDPDLVRRFLARGEAHGRELLELARAWHVDGIELDYERLSDEEWGRFLDLVGAIRPAFAAAGIRLAIVVEPRPHRFDRELPRGVGIAMMAYNLYGPHSGPGPKSTPAFIARSASWLPRANARLPVRLALATGGFEWSEGRAGARSLVEAEALRIRSRRGVPILRSMDGNHPHYAYRGEDGVWRQVWFEDATSLAAQWQAASRAGFDDLAVWRLGGNTEGLFRFLGKRRVSGTGP